MKIGPDGAFEKLPVNPTILRVIPNDAAFTMTHGWLYAMECPEGIFESAWVRLSPGRVGLVSQVFDLQSDSEGLLHAIAKITDVVEHTFSVTGSITSAAWDFPADGIHWTWRGPING